VTKEGLQTVWDDHGPSKSSDDVGKILLSKNRSTRLTIEQEAPGSGEWPALRGGTYAGGMARCETALRLKSCILCRGPVALMYCSPRIVLHDKAKGDQRQ
jgi:hypothetical protein